MRVTFGSIFRNGLIDINRPPRSWRTAARGLVGPRIHLPSDDPSAMATAMGERVRDGRARPVHPDDRSVDSRLTVADTVYSDIINR